MVHFIKDKLIKIIHLMDLVHYIIHKIKFVMLDIGKIIVLMDLVICIIKKLILKRNRILKIFKLIIIILLLWICYLILILNLIKILYKVNKIQEYHNFHIQIQIQQQIFHKILQINHNQNNQKYNFKNYGNVMKDNLKMILNMDMEFYILLMVVNLKVNLLKEKHMELEVLWGNMGRLLMVFGKIIN